MIKSYIFVLLFLITGFFGYAAAIPGGTYNVGLGQYYTNLPAAISDINTNGISGAVKLILTDATYSLTSTLVIQSSAGTTAANTLTIQPNANTAVIISGSVTAIFEFNGVSYITIDGQNNGSSLSLQNTSTSTSSAVVWLASSTTGATHNTIKNCTLTGNSSATTFADIFSGGSSIGTSSNATVANSYNVYDNNIISKAKNGIYLLGTSTSAPDYGMAVTNNILGSSAAGDGFSLSGITFKNQGYATVNGNDIQNLIYSGTAGLKDAAGNKINLGLYLFNSKNITVSSNKIHNINFSGTTARFCYGLSVESPNYNTSGSPANNVIYNNMVYNCYYSSSAASASWEFSGINENGGYGDQFYFNSIRLGGTFSSGTNYAAFSNGNGANTAASPVIIFKDNIVAIDTAISGGTSNFYCHYSKLSTIVSGNSWNHNDFAGSFSGNVYAGFYAGSSQQLFTTWQSATAKDPNSINIFPAFNTTDLHLLNCTGENSSLDGKGTAVTSPSITTDGDGDKRANPPIIGADEINTSMALSVWAGTTSTNWNTGSNWSCGFVPTTTSDVFIPVTTNQPVLNSATEIHSIHIDKSATVNLNNQLFTINGVFSGTGSLRGSALSKLYIKGSVNAGTVYFSSRSSQNQLLKLTMQSGSTLSLGSNLYIVSGSVGAYGTVTPNGTLNSNGFLTLGSNANGTAMVANCTGSITGDVTVERFIPARRAWRFLGVPFSSSSQSINSSWQEGYTNTTTTCSQNQGIAGYGTQITYIYSAGNGYDANTTSNTSIKYYQGTGWVTPTSTSGRLITQSPYCLFVRGDRTICLSEATSATPNNTILRAKGVLNQTGGSNAVTISYSGSPDDGFFVGNPYASTIDLYDILTGVRSSTNVGFDGTLTVWDPKIQGSSGDGAYVTWVANASPGTGGVWAPTTDPANGNPGSYPSGSNNEPLIESGQAFLLSVTSSNGVAQIQFQESDKTTTQLQVFGSAIRSQPTNPIAYINLMAADGTSLIDGIAAIFQQSENHGNIHNARKMWNKGNNISLYDKGQNFAIEFNKLHSTDTLFLKLNAQPQSYALNLFLKEVPGNLIPGGYIIDNYLKTKTPLQFTTKCLYKFSTNADTGSYKSRFMVILNFYDTSAAPVANASFSSINKAASLGLDVYPNPANTNYITLSSSPLKKGIYKMIIYNEDGSIIKQDDFVAIQNAINVKILLDKTWANGMYIVKLYDDKNITAATTKFVLNR